MMNKLILNFLSAQIAVSGSKSEIASAQSKVEAPNFASNLAFNMKLKDKSLMSLVLSAPTGVEKKSKYMILKFFVSLHLIPFFFLFKTPLAKWMKWTLRCVDLLVVEYQSDAIEVRPLPPCKMEIVVWNVVHLFVQVNY